VALKLPRDVIVPVNAGERLGKLSVSLDNDTLARVPVVAAARVPEGATSGGAGTPPPGSRSADT